MKTRIWIVAISSLPLVIGAICYTTYTALAQPAKPKPAKPILKPSADEIAKHFRDNPWDPGFGPHNQTEPTGDKEMRIRELLGCPSTNIVCCDPCDVCVCEDLHVKRCPRIAMMDRRRCNPDFDGD